MKWQLFVAIRYLSSRRKERFISVISLISIAGIAVGVAALIIVISVMSGFDEELKDKIIGTYSHIEIISDYGLKPAGELTKKILKNKDVSRVSYFLNGQALVRFGDSVTGVVVKGIVPQDEIKVKKLGEYIKTGKLDLGDDGIVIGSELANKLGARIGDGISLILPANIKPKFPINMARPGYVEGKDFKVTGIFTSGMYEYDSSLVYIHIRKAQELLELGDLASGVAVKVDDPFRVGSVKTALQAELGPPYAVRTWMDANRNFLEALKLEKTVMFIILTLIVMVACFNIASTLIMTVLEKTKDIGILKAIGGANSDILAVFAIQGASIGVIGTFLGVVLGVAACWILKTYKFITLPKDIYYIDKLPVRIEPNDIAVIIVTSVLISLIAAIYPAYKASRLDPVEALRYE